MREIKFRAWVKESKKMENCIEVNPFYIGDCDRLHWKHEEVELMQYTGLKDKNGKDIYEGDIVKYTFDNPDSALATDNGLKIRTDKIFWQEWRASFAVGCKMANNDLFNYVRGGNRVEVIGNIYENPELIK